MLAGAVAEAWVERFVLGFVGLEAGAAGTTAFAFGG